MTDVKLEDAERVGSFIAELRNWHAFSAPELNRLDECAALLRNIPELQQALKEQQQWATARHNQLEQQLREQVDKRIELQRRLRGMR